MNDPVAWMQTFTQVKDGVELVKHAVNIEQVGINDIPLYTHQDERPHNTVLVPCDKLAEMQAEIKALKAHPVEELNDGGEPVKNATYWKRQYNLMATQNDNLKSGLYHANEQIKYLESHPAELTDEEIIHVWNTCETDDEVEELVMKDFILFARAILRKAQEK